MTIVPACDFCLTEPQERRGSIWRCVCGRCRQVLRTVRQRGFAPPDVPLDRCDWWVPVLDHEDRFRVSSDGGVWSIRRGRLLKPDAKARYPRVNLGGRRRYVHHLVAENFLGERPAGLHVLHRDDDRANPALANLRFGSRSDNAHDAVRNRRHPQARKTECPAGHPYSAANTRINSRGARICRTCWPAGGKAPRAAAVRAVRRAAIDACSECDEQGLRDIGTDDEPLLAKCDHQNTVARQDNS